MINWFQNEAFQRVYAGHISNDSKGECKLTRDRILKCGKLLKYDKNPAHCSCVIYLLVVSVACILRPQSNIDCLHENNQVPEVTE